MDDVLIVRGYQPVNCVRARRPGTETAHGLSEQSLAELGQAGLGEKLACWTDRLLPPPNASIVIAGGMEIGRRKDLTGNFSIQISTKTTLPNYSSPRCSPSSTLSMRHAALRN